MLTTYNFWPHQPTFIALFCFFNFLPMLGSDSGFCLGGSCYSTISVAAGMPSLNTIHAIILFIFPACCQVFSRQFKFPSCTLKSFLLLVPCSAWPVRNEYLLLIACLILITWQFFCSEWHMSACSLYLSRSLLISCLLHLSPAIPISFGRSADSLWDRFISEGVRPAVPSLWPSLSLRC